FISSVGNEMTNKRVCDLAVPNVPGLYRHPGGFRRCLSLVAVPAADPLAIVALQNSQVNSEKQGCLEAFGDAYREYARRSPKWLGIPIPKAD
ncbi:MAG: hypothetical protein WA110_07620, partial [Anaerolineaceae bacterium]